MEAAISSTASTPIASASSRTWTLTEPRLYLIYELADKHDYQNQQLTIYKGTLLVKMITQVNICQYGTATLFLQKTQPRQLSSTHINTNSTYNNLTLAQGFLTWDALPGSAEINFFTWGTPLGGAEINFRGCWERTHMWWQKEYVCLYFIFIVTRC